MISGLQPQVAGSGMILFTSVSCRSTQAPSQSVHLLVCIDTGNCQTQVQDIAPGFFSLDEVHQDFIKSEPHNPLSSHLSPLCVSTYIQTHSHGRCCRDLAVRPQVSPWATYCVCRACQARSESFTTCLQRRFTWFESKRAVSLIISCLCPIHRTCLSLCGTTTV